MFSMNRRHFLAHVAGASGVLLPGMHFVQSLLGAEDKLKKENKSLIIFWMGGGPTQMDTWDLKPGSKNDAGMKEMETAVPGIKIAEVFPTVASQMKNLVLVRSLVTNEGSHDRGTQLMNTGRIPSPIVQWPSIGAVTAAQSGNKDSALPGFIGVGGTAQRIGPGFLGMNFAPFSVQNAGQPPANIAPPSSACSTPSRTASTTTSTRTSAAPTRQRKRPATPWPAPARRTPPSTRRASTSPSRR